MSGYTYNSKKSTPDNKNMSEQEGEYIDNLEEYMKQHPEIARGSFLGEWTEEMTKQLIAGLDEAEPEEMTEQGLEEERHEEMTEQGLDEAVSEEMDNHYHINESNNEDGDMDVEDDEEDDGIIDDGIIDNGTGPVYITPFNFFEYFPQYNDQSSNSNDHNNDTHHQDDYDPSFDPHLNW